MQDSFEEIPAIFEGQTYLDPTYDPAFHAFFDSEDTLVQFLNALLHLEGEKRIVSLTYKMEDTMVFQVPEVMTYRFDICATTADDRYLNIEMQRAKHSDFIDRMVLYNSFLLVKAKKERDKKRNKMPNKDKAGAKGYELPEVISIWICNFDLVTGPEFYDEWTLCSKKLQNQNKPAAIFPKNKYIVVELSKFNKTVTELTNAQDIWLYLLKHASDLKPSLPHSAEENVAINEALERIRVCAANSKLLKEQEAYMVTQEEIMSHKADSFLAGEAKGRAEGKQDAIRLMAKAMLQKGLSLAMVVDISGLTEDEIKNL